MEKGWIARDFDGSVYFHQDKPIKSDCYWINDKAMIKLEDDVYPEVSWEDESPTKVDLLISIKL